MPPIAGRCGTYEGLVQTPPPPAVVRGMAAPSATAAIRNPVVETHRSSIGGLGLGLGTVGLGDCAVCSRRHGRACDLPRRTWEGAEGVEHKTGGREARFRDCREIDRLVCVEDCQMALRKAVDVFSAIYGDAARETRGLRCDLEGLEKLIVRRRKLERY